MYHSDTGWSAGLAPVGTDSRRSSGATVQMHLSWQIDVAAASLCALSGGDVEVWLSGVVVREAAREFPVRVNLGEQIVRLSLKGGDSVCSSREACRRRVLASH